MLVRRVVHLLVIVAFLLISPVLPPASPAHAAFTVTRTDDTTTCVPGNCSLRGAIIAANAAAGMDVIMLPAGTYVLAIPGADGGADADNNAQKGDLDIPSNS